jgi:PAS domain-containing protein
MLGITVDNLMGEPKGNNKGTHWNETEYAAFRSNIASRRPFLDFVYSRTRPDGSHQYLMVSGEPMFDSSGRFTGYRGIGKDVTDSMRQKENV